MGHVTVVATFVSLHFYNSNMPSVILTGKRHFLFLWLTWLIFHGKMLRSDEWNEFLFDLDHLPKRGKRGRGTDSCGVLSLRAYGRPVSEGIRGRPRMDKLSKARHKNTVHLQEDEKFRYGRMQSLNLDKRDSSEELEVQHSSSCSRWALGFVAEGGSIGTQNNLLLVDLWCQCWTASELSIIDEWCGPH